MKRSVLLVLAAGLLLAADSPDGGLAKLEGRWLGGGWVFSGVLTFVVNLKEPSSTLDITADSVTLRSRKDEIGRWSYTLDTTRTPKAIDLTTDSGKRQLGIYEIRANPYGGYHLSLRVAQPGGDRPKDFDPKPSEGSRLYEFARYPKVP